MILYQYVLVLSRSVVSDSATSWTVPHQVPLSMGFSSQEYWSELPFHFLTHGSTCVSCIGGEILYLRTTWEASGLILNMDDALPFSRGSSQPQDQTQTSHIAGRLLSEPPGKPIIPVCHISNILLLVDGHFDSLYLWPLLSM